MEYTILILLLPLLSFLFLGLAGMKLKPVVAGAIGTAVLAVVALLSYCTAFEYFSAGRDAAGMFPTLVPWNTVWLPISRTLHIDLGILLDPISVMMLVVISTVSLMVHVYSLGYMKGERGFQRYYAFLSLFTMSMMGLVVATNIFQMYLFWELVGVSSYLLIGFYYTKKEAVAASKKAFIVTRFADLGFLVGILFYGYYAGTFSFTPDVQLLAAAGAMIPLALGLMFIGGAGKSAMFPLHIWLPDAMEGPTPVSALIHAATMGVAGVSLCVAAVAIALATWMYLRERQTVANALAARFRGLHKAAYHRFYIDEVYQFVTHRVIFACISAPVAWFDRHVVDGLMNMLARATNGAAYVIRDMQSGSVQRYCIWFLGGALGLTIFLLLIC